MVPTNRNNESNEVYTFKSNVNEILDICGEKTEDYIISDILDSKNEKQDKFLGTISVYN